MTSRIKAFLYLALLVALVVGIRIGLRVWRARHAPAVHPANAMIIRRRGVLGSYNFGRSLDLIEQVQHVKKSFQGHFRFTQDQLPPSRGELRALLSELYRESTRLNQYMEAARGASRRGLSDREYQTLLYYQRVLDRSISVVEDILRAL